MADKIEPLLTDEQVRQITVGLKKFINKVKQIRSDHLEPQHDALRDWESQNEGTLTFNRMRNRPCRVIAPDGSKTPGYFYGIYQYADVVGESLLIGGHSAGQVSRPMAIVEVNGRLQAVKINKLELLDSDAGLL